VVEEVVNKGFVSLRFGLMREVVEKEGVDIIYDDQ
jgi:hypothetical protein